MKRQNLLLLFLIAPLLVFGQLIESGKITPYTAHFLSSIKKDDINNEKSLSKLKKQFPLSEVDNEKYVHAFIKLDDHTDLSSLEAQGVKINTVLNNIITARIPVSKLESIVMLKSVKRLEIATPARKKMDKARASGNVDALHAGTAISCPFTGKDVVIGIIDGGFEFGHINFYTSDAGELRIKRVWDQNATTGTKPQGFSYGAEYASSTDILEAMTDDSSDTHGTHVAGIAAGADKNNGNTYYGVAPESDIMLVSYDLEEEAVANTSLIDGIDYIYSYASSVNKPAVVNLSLGSHLGPHDGSSLFDQAADALQGPGRLLVGAAGNEGSDDLHISKTFTSSTDTLKTFFDYYYLSDKFGYTDIWGEVNKTFKIKVVVYNANTKIEVFQTQMFDTSIPKDTSYFLTSSTDGATGEIYVYTTTDSENDRPNALVVVDMTSIKSKHHIGIVITAGEGTVHGWADDYYSFFSDNNQSGWTKGDSRYSVGEIGGTGKQIISVGAYVSNDKFTNTDGQTYGWEESIKDIASFSSIGPTLDGRVKPDITAPGSAIISSYSSSVYDNYRGYITKENTVKGETYYYGAMQGTSMATPFVTGVLATWLQAKNDLTPDEVRSVLRRTAITDSYTGTIPAEGSNTWGYGKIDAYEGLKECLRLTSIIDNHDNLNVVDYQNPTNGQFKLLFFYDDTNIKLSIYNLNGQNVLSKDIPNVRTAEEIEVDLSHLPGGVYVFKIAGQEKTISKKLILK